MTYGDIIQGTARSYNNEIKKLDDVIESKDTIIVVASSALSTSAD